MNNQWFSKVAVWLVIALVLFTVFKQFDRSASQGSQIGYSDFLEEVRGKRIKAVTLQEGTGGTEIQAVTTDDKHLRSTATYLDRGLIGDKAFFVHLSLSVRAGNFDNWLKNKQSDSVNTFAHIETTIHPRVNP